MDVCTSASTNKSDVYLIMKPIFLLLRKPHFHMAALVRVALLLVCSALPWHAAYTQSDTAKPPAEALMDLMQMDNLLQSSIEQMLQIQIQQNPSIAPFENIMLDYLNKQMSYEQLKPDLIRIYTDAFSDEELNELIDFYKTPTGAKSIRLMPDLMQQGAQLGTAKVQENIAELEQSIQAEADRLKEEKNASSDSD